MIIFYLIYNFIFFRNSCRVHFHVTPVTPVSCAVKSLFLFPLYLCRILTRSLSVYIDVYRYRSKKIDLRNIKWLSGEWNAWLMSALTQLNYFKHAKIKKKYFSVYSEKHWIERSNHMYIDMKTRLQGWVHGAV